MQTRLFAAVCFVVAAANAHAQIAPSVPIGERERDHVRRAVLDYVEGFYEGDTAKLTRALRPDVSKYGFWRDSTGKYDGKWMITDVLWQGPLGR